MIIRPVTSSDIAEVAAVQAASWKTAYRGLMPDAGLDAVSAADFAHDWRILVNDASRTNLLVEYEGRVAGYVSFGPGHDTDVSGQAAGEIHGLYLAPTYWRMGLGRAICQAALQSLWGAGYDVIVLWVLSGNMQARGFYERAGFALEPGREKTVRKFGADLHHVRYRMTAWATPQTSRNDNA